jgi:ABC-type oligopeptide transport system substrate-binding subunit
MYNDFLAGKNDVSALARSKYDSAKLRPDLHESGALTRTAYELNPTLPPVDDVRMRQAFALALNKVQLVQDTLDGRGSATNHLVPTGTPGTTLFCRGRMNQRF